MHTPHSWKPWLVCLGAALFFYYVFFQLAMFNTISAPLMQTFGLQAPALGTLSSSYFFATKDVLQFYLVSAYTFVQLAD